MQKVIGLDIGSYSIKAVEIVNSFKSYEITNFYEVVIPQGDDVSPDILIPQCMEQLFKENNLQADRILTAMPGQYISSRIVSLGFSDPRKIETAVYAEVEDAVPFNLDDMILDHQILGQVNGKTMVMVVMTRKNFLRSFLEHLQRVNIDPKLVDVDSLAFYNLAPHMRLQPDECVALVDIGHEKTSVCVVQNGILKMFRSINLGGAFLTDFLSRDLEADTKTAQELKHRVSRVVSEADPGLDLSLEDRLIAERMTLATNAIVKELGRTFYAFKTWDKTEISRIFLSGGTSRIQGLCAYLTEQLGFPVDLNRLEQSELKIASHLQSQIHVIPQGVAVGLRAVLTAKKASQINLRKDEFAYVQNYEQVMRAAGLIGRVVGLALALLMVSYGIKQFFYGRQITALEAEYMQEVASIGKKKPTGAVAFTKFRADTKSQLDKDIKARREAVTQFEANASRSMPLMALADLSAAIPRTVKVDITEFSFASSATADGGKIKLAGETDGYSSVESIKESLKKVPSMQDLEEKQSTGKPGTDNKIIQFLFNMTFTPNSAFTKNKS
jgi:type IV pilus assembly protein PilM